MICSVFNFRDWQLIWIVKLNIVIRIKASLIYTHVLIPQVVQQCDEINAGAHLKHWEPNYKLLN